MGKMDDRDTGFHLRNKRYIIESIVNDIVTVLYGDR